MHFDLERVGQWRGPPVCLFVVVFPAIFLLFYIASFLSYSVVIYVSCSYSHCFARLNYLFQVVSL